MPYIGNQPSESFTSFATQEFSTSATTSYTLDHAVTNENEIALFINNVRQQPGSGKAYTATGTALTLSAATASTDTMDCVFLGRALQTVTPATNSITAAMVSNDLISGKDALTSSAATTDEFLISDAGTLKRIDAQFFQNTPAFEAYLNTTTGITDNTAVKATFDTERFDTDNTFSSSRFTPAIAGKYFCYSGCRVGNDGANTLTLSHVSFYKNGSAYLINTTPTVIFNASSSAINNYGAVLTQVIDLDSDDYVEVYVQCDTSTGSPDLINGSFFGAYKIIT